MYNECYARGVVRLLFSIYTLFIFGVFFGGCTSSFLKLEKKEADFVKNVEFDAKVKIKELPAESEEVSVKNETQESAKIIIEKTVEEKKAEEKKQALLKKKTVKSKKSKKDAKKPQTETSDKVDLIAKKAEITAASISSNINNNETEDKEGIDGRRPIIDPFRVGEEVTHELHYFKVAAGELKLKVGPFVEVNGRRSYKFITELESSRMFSSFYSVKDIATTYVDFMELVPHVFTLAVKETGQIKDAKGLFDIASNKATYWEKKFTKKNGQEELKKEWDILPYSQNVYSAAFYMRLFKWEIGKEYAFRVADAGENIVFRGKAVRKEKIKTEIGDFNAIVIKPEITAKGIFKPIGDIYFWLSDDDRKYILRIESSIKIGTIVSEIIKLEPGK